MPPTCPCYGNTCRHPQGGALQRIYYKKRSEPMHNCKILKCRF